MQSSTIAKNQSKNQAMQYSLLCAYFKVLHAFFVFAAISILAIAVIYPASAQGCSSAMIGDNLVCADEMNSIEKAIIESTFDGSSQYYGDQLPSVMNSKSEKISTRVLYHRPQGRDSQAMKIENNNAQIPVFPTVSENVDLEMIIEAPEPQDSKILHLNNMTYRRNMTIGVDKLPQTRDYIFGRTEMESYAINLDGINFTDGTLTAIAKGNMLWKCAEWNFTQQSCMGTWNLLSTLTPGTEYNISLFPGDPGYVETFDAQQSLDVAMTALGEEKIVIAWINNESNYYASFEIWHTNGTLLVDEVDFETTGGAASRVDVAAINRTHFVLGLIDGPDQDEDFFIYDMYGNQVVGATQLDGTIGAIADVAVCELGDRFAVLNENAGDSDADFFIRANDGTALVAQTAVDATTAPGAGGQNLVDCVALNDTRWAYLFYDDADNDITNAIVNGSGSILVAATDIDIDVGETGQVAGAGLGGGKYAVVFYDATDQDVSLRTTQLTAANTLTVLYTGDLDITAGADSRVAAAEVMNSSSSYVVAAWQDAGSGDIKAGVYDSSGNVITAPFTITTTETAAYKLLDVVGYNSLLEQGLCNYTFAIAYTNASMSSVFETYWINGTRWNGVCPRNSESNAPEIQIFAPQNNTENTTTSNIDFVYSVSDENPVVNCSLYIDGELNSTNTTIIRDSSQAFTVDFENGNYTWEIECYDYFGNRNTSGLYNLNVSVFFYSSNALDIDIDALDENTLVMAWIDGGVGNYLSFEVINTNGTKVVEKTDIDITGDNSSAVAVASINSTHFVVGWIDGPENDLSHAGYTRTGQNFIPSADLDTAIGANADVDVCELGDRYAIIDANGGDSDADYRIQGNLGDNLTAESAVDITITPGANNQNLVACSAVNSSAWIYGFYDDADNDATVAAVQNNGAAIGTNLDIDSDVGEEGQVAVAGLRNNSFAYVYYDNVSSAVYMTILQLAGASWNTIAAPTAVDSNAGGASRVSAAEIESYGESNFVAAWYDAADTTIKAAVYNSTGGEVAAPFIVSSNPTALPSIISVTGVHSSLGIGLCRRTFAIAYTNSSGYAVFRTYFQNGTVWDGNCPEITPPSVGTINTAPLISLNAGGLKRAECNASIEKGIDLSEIVSVEGVLFRSNMSSSGPADENLLYRNSTCTRTQSGSASSNYSCSFYMYYFAANGSWNCTINALNADAKGGTNTTQTGVDTLYAINTSTLYLEYGNIPPGSNSSDFVVNMTNYGNMPFNVTVRGYGGDNPAAGDGYSMMCLSGENITIGYEKYSLGSGKSYSQKTNLTSLAADINLTIPKQTAVGIQKTNSSYWQMYVPPLTKLSECNGTVVFTATST